MFELRQCINCKKFHFGFTFEMCGWMSDGFHCRKSHGDRLNWCKKCFRSHVQRAKEKAIEDFTKANYSTL